MQVELSRIEDIASNIKTFWFKPDKPIRYMAGQFIELQLPHNEPDERGIKRWFTLSSSPTESPFISISTKFASHNGSTFKHMLLSLKPGDKVSMSEPMGDFVLPKDISRPLLFVAGGMGITPIRSMVKWLSDSDEKRDVRILYALTHLDEYVFAPVFEASHLPLTIILSEPSDNWDGETGRLSAERIKQEMQSEDALIYISGPEPMVETLIPDLEKIGVHKRQLVGDYFPGYPTV